MDDAERRHALARFLRARRERLLPERAGVPSVGRRRTPGLRREELAQLAGVGTTWYTWLEQGRKIRVSAAVLDSIARALQLDADERTYLFVLARDETPNTPLAGTPAISPALQRVVDSLALCPCYVTDARWNVVAWNRAACAVFGDFAALSGRERNILWRVFTTPEQRTRLVHWEDEARIVLALFRASTSRYVGEPWYSELIADLSQMSTEFAAWWAQADLRGAYSGQKELEHPLVGRLQFQPVTLQAADAPDLRLLAFPPLPGSGTEHKLQRLLSIMAASDVCGGSQSGENTRFAADSDEHVDADPTTSPIPVVASERQ